MTPPEPAPGGRDLEGWSRHPERSNAFDAAILASDRRAWHPLGMEEEVAADRFDVDRTPLLPESMIVALATPYVSDRLGDPALRTRFINETVRIYLSDVLAGERAAFAHAARLCLSARDLGEQEHAANQAREEARHAAAFSFYIQRRWGSPAPVTPVFASLLRDVEAAGDGLVALAGMQVLIEGLAMGIFTALGGELRDPLGRKLIANVMADEASHLKHGATWIEQAIAESPPGSLATTALWTARQFTRMTRGLFAPTQRPNFYNAFHLDAQKVASELRAAGKGRTPFSAATTIFRSAARAVERAGLIDDRTRSAYAAFLQANA